MLALLEETDTREELANELLELLTLLDATEDTCDERLVLTLELDRLVEIAELRTDDDCAEEAVPCTLPETRHSNMPVDC